MTKTRPKSIYIIEVDAAARKRLPALAKRWMPTGHLEGRFWIAQNPNNAETKRPTLEIDLKWGRWNDYSIGKTGVGAVDLAAYLSGLTEKEATALLAKMLRLV